MLCDGNIQQSQTGLTATCFISQTAKDIIIRGGENISATEVENAVYNDTRIADWYVRFLSSL